MQRESRSSGRDAMVRILDMVVVVVGCWNLAGVLSRIEIRAGEGELLQGATGFRVLSYISSLATTNAVADPSFEPKLYQLPRSKRFSSSQIYKKRQLACTSYHDDIRSFLETALECVTANRGTTHDVAQYASSCLKS